MLRFYTTLAALEEKRGRGGKGEKGKWGDGAAVYPNPASDWLTIESGDFIPGNYMILIYNSQGAQVRCTDVYLSENKLSFPVNIFQPGIYFGKLIAHNGTANFPSGSRFPLITIDDPELTIV